MLPCIHGHSLSRSGRLCLGFDVGRFAIHSVSSIACRSTADSISLGFVISCGFRSRRHAFVLSQSLKMANAVFGVAWKQKLLGVSHCCNSIDIITVEGEVHDDPLCLWNEYCATLRISVQSTFLLSDKSHKRKTAKKARMTKILVLVLEIS